MTLHRLNVKIAKKIRGLQYFLTEYGIFLAHASQPCSCISDMEWHLNHVLVFQTWNGISAMFLYFRHGMASQPCYCISDMEWHLNHVLVFQSWNGISAMFLYFRHGMASQPCSCISDMEWHLNHVLVFQTWNGISAMFLYFRHGMAWRSQQHGGGHRVHARDVPLINGALRVSQDEAVQGSQGPC